jgi:hypothetical protein
MVVRANGPIVRLVREGALGNGVARWAERGRGAPRRLNRGVGVGDQAVEKGAPQATAYAEGVFD